MDKDPQDSPDPQRDPNDHSIISRPIRQQDDKGSLLPPQQDWKQLWWGMPSFAMGDAEPARKIVLNFMTEEDVKDFAKMVNRTIHPSTGSMWFPKQESTGGHYWGGEPLGTRYPVCIPSKGRAKHQTTSRHLDRLGVKYKFFVEETEYDEYCEALGADSVIKLPFHDLGQGSIPARNAIWEWAKKGKHKRHWVIDDNIECFVRCTNNRRLLVKGGGYFRAMEDFVDRYENIALAGPHDAAFMYDRTMDLSPFLLNSRVYSVTLIDTSLPHRWRGKYNEDTDLSLRVLKDGYCTCLFRALLMQKPETAFSKGAKPMPGGNTDNVYNQQDYRLAFAESLRDQHPDVVKVVWKFNRWHHQVDYSRFARNRLVPRKGIVPKMETNNYGMELLKKRKG